MQTEIICPLGSKCEEAKDGKVFRCAWYTHLTGKSPQSEEIVDEWKCAMTWMPLMMVENAQQVRGMTAATESFRNESVKGVTKLNQILAGAAASAKRIEG
jgi:hypothetical protein